PLAKGLWFGKTTKDKLPVHEPAFYKEHGVELSLRREVVELDPENHTVWDDRGVAHQYGRLLLATGGRPRRLDVEGSDLESIHYFRSLEDYLFLEGSMSRVQHAVVLGGGFIAIELAAALRHARKEVAVVYPHEVPPARGPAGDPPGPAWPARARSTPTCRCSTPTSSISAGRRWGTWTGASRSSRCGRSRSAKASCSTYATT